jgi:hypothetical protein
MTRLARSLKTRDRELIITVEAEMSKRKAKKKQMTKAITPEIEKEEEEDIKEDISESENNCIVVVSSR